MRGAVGPVIRGQSGEKTRARLAGNRVQVERRCRSADWKSWPPRIIFQTGAAPDAVPTRE